MGFTFEMTLLFVAVCYMLVEYSIIMSQNYGDSEVYLFLVGIVTAEAIDRQSHNQALKLNVDL